MTYLGSRLFSQTYYVSLVRRRGVLVPLTLNVSAVSLLPTTIKAQRRQGSGSGRPADHWAPPCSLQRQRFREASAHSI